MFARFTGASTRWQIFEMLTHVRSFIALCVVLAGGCASELEDETGDVDAVLSGNSIEENFQ